MSALSFRAYLIALLIATLCLSVWWFKDTLLFVSILVIANVIGLWLLLRGKLIMLYLFLFIGAIACEAAMIYLGVWEYTSVHVLGFPIWLPFLWFSAIVFVGVGFELLHRNVFGKR